MGDFGYEYDDDEQDERGDGPADLRKAHKAATRKIKELESKITELTATNTTLSKRVRHLDIADLLPKGVSPKVAKLIPDTVEPTADAVKAWLDEFGDVFNIKTGEPTAETVDNSDGDDAPAGDDTPQVPSELAEALAGFTQMSAGGTAVPSGAIESLTADVTANAKSVEDVLAIMQKHGISAVNGY